MCITRCCFCTVEFYSSDCRCRKVNADYCASCPPRSASSSQAESMKDLIAEAYAITTRLSGARPVGGLMGIGVSKADSEMCRKMKYCAEESSLRRLRRRISLMPGLTLLISRSEKNDSIRTYIIGAPRHCPPLVYHVTVPVPAYAFSASHY
ncbi:hypothetical protein EDD85DRAFT_601524 [Armillaria nabsnona]|nr:hypothetical protein EDD85DRAFT_601524 [Armillaria nabsnona]